MAILTEGQHAGDFIVSEANGYRSRETGIIAASQTLMPGAVLGLLTGTGQYVAYNDAAADGSETAAAILINAVTTAAGETAEAALIVRDAEVNEAELVFLDATPAPAITAALADLAARGIIARSAV